MILGTVFFENSQRPLIHNVQLTENLWEKTRGLLFTPNINMNEGLIILPCASIHTFGMRFPIDVVFLDSSWGIVKIVKNLKPWRIAGHFRATATLELMAGESQRLELNMGGHLTWRKQ